MANFNTHFTVAAAASGLVSVLCLQVGLVTHNETLFLALLGTFGGILPDVDLQRSYPSRILFSFMATFAAFVVVFSVENDVSIIELWLLAVLVFLLVRFPVWQLFHRYTSHRGSVHSITAGLIAMFLTVTFAHRVLDYTAFVSWLMGAFILLGFSIHLILDEIYSVDFSNRKIKRSFGTALKLLDTRKPVKAFVLVGLALLTWWVTPSGVAFWDTFSSPQTYHIVAARLLPENLNHLTSFAFQK